MPPGSLGGILKLRASNFHVAIVKQSYSLTLPT